MLLIRAVVSCGTTSILSLCCHRASRLSYQVVLMQSPGKDITWPIIGLTYWTGNLPKSIIFNSTVWILQSLNHLLQTFPCEIFILYILWFILRRNHQLQQTFLCFCAGKSTSLMTLSTWSLFSVELLASWAIITSTRYLLVHVVITGPHYLLVTHSIDSTTFWFSLTEISTDLMKLCSLLTCVISSFVTRLSVTGRSH